MLDSTMLSTDVIKKLSLEGIGLYANLKYVGDDNIQTYFDNCDDEEVEKAKQELLDNGVLVYADGKWHIND